MTSQGTAQLILVFFIAATLASYQFTPAIMTWTETAKSWEAVALYILVNPVYLTAIGYLSSKFGPRGFAASLMIVMAYDIVSPPHVVTGEPHDGLTSLFMDSIIYKAAPWIGLFGLYVVLPILLVVGAYELVAPTFFVKTFKRQIS
jgi:hypothetical protein